MASTVHSPYPIKGGLMPAPRIPERWTRCEIILAALGLGLFVLLAVIAAGGSGVVISIGMSLMWSRSPKAAASTLTRFSPSPSGTWSQSCLAPSSTTPSIYMSLCLWPGSSAHTPVGSALMCSADAGVRAAEPCPSGWADSSIPPPWRRKRTADGRRCTMRETTTLPLVLTTGAAHECKQAH